MKKRMQKHVLSFAATLMLILGGGMQLYAADRIADTVYRNGKIYTITETAQEAKDPNNAQKADVVATLNGKIVFVGSEADAKAQGYLDAAQVSKIVDLRGKTMLPGFIDGHGHFPQQGSPDLYQVNLNSPLLDGPADTMEHLIQALAAKAETVPAGEPIIGYNYDDTQLAEQRHPNRHDLDKASSKHPILLRHISGHMSVANTAALEKYRITKENTTEGLVKDADGNPTGLMLEGNAMALVPLGNELKTNPLACVLRSDQVYAAAGVTTGDSGTTMVITDIPAFQKSLLRGYLNIRLIYHPIGYYGTDTEEFNSGWMNRAALGWKDTTGNAPEATRFADGTGSYKTGADITSLPVVLYNKDASGNIVGTPYEMLDPGYAEVGQAELPEQRVFLGAWKLLEDGSPQGYTAWMKKPGYYDWDKYTAEDSFNNAGYFNGLPGTRYYTSAGLTHAIGIFHKYGQSTETHTNGSGAAEAYVTALENVVAMYPTVKDTRHTSIHAQTMERQHIQRLTGDYAGLENTGDMYEELDGAFANGVVDKTLGGKLPAGNLPELMKAQNFFNSYFNNHTYFYGYRHTNKFFGPGRAFNMSPAGWSEAYGLPYSFHNDTFVTPISPLRSIQSGVTRFSGDARAVDGQENLYVTGTGKDVNAKAQYKARITDTETRDFWTYDQRVNPLQAIRAVTIAPAYQNKIEGLVGSLEEGKLADFVILDEDIMDVAKTDPMRIAKMRVATTIVGDKVVHGILPDSNTFVTQFHASYDQPTLDADVKIVHSDAIPHDVADKDYASLEANEKRFGTYSFTATVEPDSSAVFQMNFLGNGEAVSSLKLYKLTANVKTAYEYGRPDSAGMASASGRWWVADFTNPTVPLAPEAVLTLDAQYVAFFIIHDNDEIFDANKADGMITDPVSLVTTTGTLPTNGGTADTTHDIDDGGSSSGCTVGSTPSYDLLVLFLGMSAVAAIRVLRRRNEQ